MAREYKKRTRSKSGQYIKDDPKTPENEAWSYTGPKYLWIGAKITEKINSYKYKA
tara:strand:- start:2117 stop:2281 length:165 start_codon:yes stop_codon:yes gene_type:complete